MKILYLTDPGLDYLGDQLYTGLCKLLGHEQVVDYPYKPAYHDPNHKAWYLPQNSARSYEREEIWAGLEQKEFDFVILASLRQQALETLQALSAKCAVPPLVMIDGEDDDRIQGDLFRRLNARLYFKREYRGHQRSGIRGWWERWRQFGRGQDLLCRTYPLPFSVILETVPILNGIEQDLDISFVGRISHRKRAVAVKMLTASRDIHFEGWTYAESTDRRSKFASTALERVLAKCQGDPYVTTQECGRKLSSTEYYRLLGRSRMGLSIRGGGFDTVRYWEIVASKRLLISEWPDISIPFNFEHKKHAVFCRPDLSDLQDLVRLYAKDQAARQSIVAEGYAHLLKYHTCERRAEYFLDACRRLL